MHALLVLYLTCRPLMALGAGAAGVVDVDRIVAGMGLQEKVGQLMMVGLGGTTIDVQAKRWVQSRHVGGVALFSRNIVNMSQTATLVRSLLALATGYVPPFVALDQEGGPVVRLHEGATVLPGNMALGAGDSDALAYAGGHVVGVDLWRLGFNMNLAPVLDVYANPHNSVIGIRAFGGDARRVGQLGAWFIRGQQEMGVSAVAKHFPGHGDTRTDSHFTLPTTDVGLVRLQAVEFVPFVAAIEAGVDAVMTAHIALPQVAEDAHVPATLSHVVLTRLLREKLGFEGVIMTDGLEMQAIVGQGGIGRAAVRALLAGADMPMVLWSEAARDEVWQALWRACRRGEVPRWRLDQAVRRIVSLKVRRGLFGRVLEPVASLVADGNDNPVHAQLAQRIATRGVTVLHDAHHLLPLDRTGLGRVVALVPPGALAARLRALRGVDVTTIDMPLVPSRAERQACTAAARRALRGASLLVAAVINHYHVDIAQAALAPPPDATARARVRSIVVSLASPYLAVALTQADASVCTFSYRDTAQRAAAAGILGEAPMPGRLPVQGVWSQDPL